MSIIIQPSLTRRGMPRTAYPALKASNAVVTALLPEGTRRLLLPKVTNRCCSLGGRAKVIRRYAAMAVGACINCHWIGAAIGLGA
jgi:hypothetical protein